MRNQAEYKTKRMAEERILKEFGKLPQDMTLEELLSSLSAVYRMLYEQTEDDLYKAKENAVLCMLKGYLSGENANLTAQKVIGLLTNRCKDTKKIMQ